MTTITLECISMPAHGHPRSVPHRLTSDGTAEERLVGIQHRRRAVVRHDPPACRLALGLTQ